MPQNSVRSAGTPNLHSLIDNLRGSIPIEESIDIALRETFKLWSESQRKQEMPSELSRWLLSEEDRQSAAAHKLRAALQIHIESSGDTQSIHMEAFEGLLDLSAHTLGRARQESRSSQELNAFINEITDGAESVFDPACGVGGTLLALHLPRTARIVGNEIDSNVARIAEMRLLLHGYEHIDIRSMDSLKEESQDTWDLIVTQPPFGMRLDRESLSFRLRSELPQGKAVQGDVAWLQLVSNHLTDSGRAFIVFPPQAITSKLGSGDLLRRIAEADCLDAIVALPPGLIPGTQTGSVLLGLSKNRPKGKSGSTIVCSAAELGKKSYGTANHDSTSSLLKAWIWKGEQPLASDWHAKLVSTKDLFEVGFLPQYHLSLPPAEQEVRPDVSGRFLTSLRLENFKSIASRADVPLRPLTLIYGKNSAGKSSLIQALLLLKQSLLSDRVRTSGEHVDLGSFIGLLHRHDPANTMQIGVSYASTPDIDSVRVIPNPSESRRIDFALTDEMFRLNGGPSSVSIQLGTERVAFESDETGAASFRMSLGEIEKYVDLAFRNDATFPQKRATTGGQARRLVTALKRMGIDSVPVDRENLMPGSIPNEFFREVDHRDPSAQSRPGLSSSVLRRGSEYWAAFGDELRHLLDRMSYIGPLRQPPARFSQRQQSATGVDMPFFLLDNASERAQVSKWLRRLGTNYELDAVNPIRPENREAVGDIASVLLTDRRSGVQVTPADVGFGISQVLPIVTELSARSNSLVLIEQPEIHLHPAMQAELADLLIESTSEEGRGNQIIAETHSETLVLRVQTRIREGMLSPKDVIVLYVDQTAEGAGVIKELRLDENGEFIDMWPGGFFDEQFNELFGDI